MSTMSFKIYLARAGGSGEDETYALDNGVAILGFREYASLAGAKDYDDIVSIVKAATPGIKPRAAGNFAGQLWAFALAMKQGDIVVLPRKLTSQPSDGSRGPTSMQRLAASFDTFARLSGFVQMCHVLFLDRTCWHPLGLS